MKALWLQDRELSLRDVPVPDAASAGEALIRVRLSGICGTDLELVRGYYPYTGVLGHEFVGEVVEAPDETWVGARVVADTEVTTPCNAWHTRPMTVGPDPESAAAGRVPAPGHHGAAAKSGGLVQRHHRDGPRRPRHRGCSGRF